MVKERMEDRDKESWSRVREMIVEIMEPYGFVVGVVTTSGLGVGLGSVDSNRYSAELE